jgi:tRNA A37 threonylcarbamoyladenosine modification protein TsaB
LNVLTIDAATQAELVAAAADERVADETRKTDASHSVTLFENIERALASLGITIRDVTHRRGLRAGSFTGVRSPSPPRPFAQVLAPDRRNQLS